MPRLQILYTDYKESEFRCDAWKFDQGQLVVSHPDMSIEYINRSIIRSLRVWNDEITP